jgi:hypothetical protein
MAGCKWLVSIGPLRSLLIAGQNLVCVSRSGNRKQRQKRNNGQRFHGEMLGFDCGQKRQSLAPFLANPAKQSWPWPDLAASISVSLVFAKGQCRINFRARKTTARRRYALRV